MLGANVVKAEAEAWKARLPRRVAMDSESKVFFIVFPFAFGFSLGWGAIESGIVSHENYTAWPVPET